MMTTNNILATPQTDQTQIAPDDRQALHAILSANLDQLLAASRPQLLRIAQALGNAPDVAEDITQETCLEALRHLDRVYSLAGFDQWLNEICRNVCRRHAHAQGIQQRHQVAMASWDSGDDGELDIADLSATDPFAELDRQDLALVLDRALGYLPGKAREAVELCYLAEVPQREAAARLGLTIKALETRLIRARRQLREVLSGALRDDAMALDLLPSAEPSLGWRETRIWCNECGHAYLRGIFEPMADGHINFRMRCTLCSPHSDIDMTDTAGFVPLEDLCSFRPALKRVEHIKLPYYQQGLAGMEHRCWQCHQSAQLRIMAADALPLLVSAGRYYVVQQCANGHRWICQAARIARYSHPLLERFAAAHPRWIDEPETPMEYQGQPALRFRMVAVTSAARCTYLAHAQTLRVLAVFEE